MIAAANFAEALDELEISPESLDRLIASGDIETLQLIHSYVTHPLRSFTPRPDRPAEFEEQTAFVNDDESQFAICLGGTGSGKTLAAAYKTARYVLTTPPPRPRVPFWIIGDTYDTTIDVCWNEKLSKFIPDGAIEGYVWYKTARKWPLAVLLKHPTIPSEVGWILEFKSYDQGLSAMKAKSIGGFWFNEEVPFPIVAEVMGRCRDYNSPGWADFTPVECKSPEWPDLYADPPKGWKFYHLNTSLNFHLPSGWFENYIATIPEDMRELRTIGKFSILHGQVFKEWRKEVHVCKPFDIPLSWRKIRGIDFGWNNAFCCLWIAVDHDGCYWIYDEHYRSQQLLSWHAEQINRRKWDHSQPWYGRTYCDHQAQEYHEMDALIGNCHPALRKDDLNRTIDYLRSLMMVQQNGSPKLRVFENCVNLIREIPGYRWTEGTTGRNPADAPLDKDNHAISAARYAIFSDYLAQNSTPLTKGRRMLPDPKRRGVQFQR